MLLSIVVSRPSYLLGSYCHYILWQGFEQLSPTWCIVIFCGISLCTLPCIVCGWVFICPSVCSVSSSHLSIHICHRRPECSSEWAATMEGDLYRLFEMN